MSVEWFLDTFTSFKGFFYLTNSLLFCVTPTSSDCIFLSHVVFRSIMCNSKDTHMFFLPLKIKTCMSVDTNVPVTNLHTLVSSMASLQTDKNTQTP